jgi:hypothetical protein
VIGTRTPDQNRQIGRKTLLLQMINPGAGGETAEKFDLVTGQERNGGQRG